MSKVAFVITKPLQLLVSLAIIETFSKELTTDLIITNDFCDAESISKRINTHLKKAMKQINGVIFFENQTTAYKHLMKSAYDSIYIDSDVGFKRYIEILWIKAKKYKSKISVYEEGLGTYRNDIFKNDGAYDFIKKKIFHILGIGYGFGGNFLVNEIYLFNPIEYNSPQNKKIIINKIYYDIPYILNKYTILLAEIFLVASHFTKALNKNINLCTIYLSNWTMDEAAISKISKISDLLLVKPHPHIKTKLDHVPKTIFIDQSIPAEILIDVACDFYEKVIVYHHGSSVPRYANYENIEYIRIE
jgi:hypothetical protein